MPRNTYNNSKIALKNAKSVLKQTGCDAIKLESHRNNFKIIQYLVSKKIPVMGHIGYTPQFKKKFELGLIRNHYVGRTFIEPLQNIRSLGVKLKLNTTKTIIKNKSIILIDDSLVRGTTCHKIVKMLLENGAREIHVRIACPEIKFPDFYGVDMPTKKELLANEKNIDEMAKYINATTLRFLSIEGLYSALIGEKRNTNYPQFSDHYFTGDYPIKPQDNINNIRLKQLSLLSRKSNN